MLKYSMLTGLVLMLTFHIPSVSHAVETSRADVRVVDTNGIPINEFRIRLIRITGNTAHKTGRYEAGFQSEQGKIITSELNIKNKQGLVHLVNLEVGHYQIDVRADRYRLPLSKWGYSRIDLQRDDVVTLSPHSKFDFVYMRTHHFDVAKGKNTDVKITMLAEWTLFGSVTFSENTSLPSKKWKQL